MGSPGRVGSRLPERRERASGKRLEQVSRQLSDRDLAVLNSIDNYGFLTTNHIERLHFTTHATPEAAARICRRVLGRLRSDRLIEPLQRRIGGLRAGSASYVWRLGPLGDRVLRRAEPDAPRARRKEPSERFLQHRLAVAGTSCDLTDASRHGRFELVQVDPEPASWCDFSDYGGSREILKPDLFAVTASGEFEDFWFIEIDLGNESLPVVLKQCAAYERYRRTGREQAAAGVFPRVVWLVPDNHRAERLQGAITDATELDTALYRVGLLGNLPAIVVAEAAGGDDHGAQS